MTSDGHQSTLDVDLDQRLGGSPAPAVDIAVRASRLGPVRPADLLTIARRDNPKRAVLFVSRVLGKHLPVDPSVALLAGRALGEAVGETLGPEATRQPPSPPYPPATAELVTALVGRSQPESTRPGSTSEPGAAIVIGYAETATALGHAVRHQLGAGPTSHTTRVVLDNRAPLLTFSEPHSHAVEHLLYHHDPAFLAPDLPVVLVDDELTSGQTALNTIEAIQRQWPRARYIVASLVDWRSESSQAAFAETAERLGTRIDAVALLAGDVTVHPAPPLDDHEPDADGIATKLPLSQTAVEEIEVEVGAPTARAGWSDDDQDRVPAIAVAVAEQLAARRQGPSALVLGTEELMYVPMVMAAALGSGVTYRSTTRSPIIPSIAAGYPIKSRTAFPNPYGPGMRFLYNATTERYDDIFVCFEGRAPGPDHPLLTTLGRCGRRVHAVVLR